MKRNIIAAILVLSISFTTASPVFAMGSKEGTARFDSTAGLIEVQCESSYELTASTQTALLNIGDKYSVVDVAVKENGVFVHTIHVDPGLNIIQYVDASGSVIKQDALSDIVTISESQQKKIPGQGLQLSTNQTPVPRFTDMIEYEQLSVSPTTGQQDTVFGAPVFDGYEYLGNRGDFYYAPGSYGYLQRQNAGVSSSGYAKRFTFSSGSSVATIAAIILSAVTGTGIVLSILTGMVTAVIGSAVDYAGSLDFEVCDYRWNYRTRLNGNIGAIMDRSYRTRSYWKLYAANTGVVNYKYRGTIYDGGFASTNLEMISNAIKSYFGT